MINKKTIKFETSSPVLEGIKPNKSFLPKWYKDLPTHINNKPQFVPDRSHAIKTCMPFLDAFTSGYSIPLVGDLLVEQVSGFPVMSWGGPTLALSRGSDSFGNFPTPVGFSSSHFIWQTWVSIELPKGYSALFTHPLNRFDLPFITLSGIVDDYEIPNGQIPFFIKEGFEGVIPQGTPIVQILPFKREDWKSEKKGGLFIKGQINAEKSNLVLSGFYKKNNWKKKSYE